MDDPKNSVMQRLYRGFAGQAFSQIVQLSVRLVEVSLLIKFWGVNSYGEWIMISAIATVMALSDAGFTKTAQREMIIRASRFEHSEVLVTFQSTSIFLLILTAVVLFFLSITLTNIHIERLIEFKTVSSPQFVAILLLTTLRVMISFQSDLLSGVLSSSGAYGTGTFYTAIAALLELIGLVVAVMLGAHMVGAAAATLGGRITSLVLARYAIKKHYSVICYGQKHASRNKIRQMSLLSIANLAFPIGETLNLQGLRLLIGATLGPTNLVIFSTTQTLCRIVLQAVMSIARTVEPEISLAYGASDHRRVRQLLVQGTQATLWFSIFLSFIMMMIGSTLFNKWTGGHLQYDWKVASGLIAASIINALWCVAIMVPTATNQHVGISPYFVLIYGVGSLILANSFISIYGLPGAALSVAIIESIMATFAINIASKIAGQPLVPWILTAATPPFGQLKKFLRKLFFCTY